MRRASDLSRRDFASAMASCREGRKGEREERVRKMHSIDREEHELPKEASNAAALSLLTVCREQTQYSDAAGKRTAQLWHAQSLGAPCVLLPCPLYLNSLGNGKQAPSCHNASCSPCLFSGSSGHLLHSYAATHFKVAQPEVVLDCEELVCVTHSDCTDEWKGRKSTNFLMSKGDENFPAEMRCTPPQSH